MGSAVPAAQLSGGRRRKLLAGPLGVCASIPLTVLLIVGWIGSERAIHPAAVHYETTLADYPQLRGQEIVVHSRTGAKIAGMFFPGKRRTVVVLSHGYGGNQSQMLPYAAFLHDAGYSVLTYDMRDRGRSGGTAVTLGVLEQIDLLSVIDYLMTRSDIDRREIGTLGLSLGGAVALLAAARDKRIGAVVDDSGFSDAASAIGDSFEHFIGLPAFPFAHITIAIAGLRAGVDLGDMRPVDVVWQISPRPLLIIHCVGDTVLRIGNSERNFAAAGEPKEMWPVRASVHLGAHAAVKGEYERRVVEFFDRWSSGKAGP